MDSNSAVVEAVPVRHALVGSTVADNLPAMVKNELARLSAAKQAEFLEEYNRKSRQTAIAYVLWFFLGFHYVYQKKWGIQILFWLTSGGFFVWWLVDAFRVPGMIKNYNKDVAIDTLRNLKAISA
jgi:hypothetical protein